MKPEDAPKSFADLLDPKWTGKMVKAHPAYSGTIMTATFQIARDLGWGYFEKLAKQNIMQVQSSTDPPKKLALGERAVMADGNDYNLIQLKERGQPVEVVYPAEGTPFVTGPTAIFTAAPNPNAARLFQNWLHSRREAQQLLVDFARQHSLARAGDRKAGRPQAFRDQADEGRRGRCRSAGRRDQGALCEDFRSVNDRSLSPRRARASISPGRS